MEYKLAHYLSIDPGKTTGWASFNIEGDLLQRGTVELKKLAELLGGTTPQIIIYETFALRPWKAADQSWSTFPASQVIGALEFYASMTEGVTLVGQDPNCKESGYKWSFTPKAKSHRHSHDRDAYAHGVYYMIKNKIKKVAHYIPKK